MRPCQPRTRTFGNRRTASPRAVHKLIRVVVIPQWGRGGAQKSASPSNHSQALRWRETCDPNCAGRVHAATDLAPVFAAMQHRSSFQATDAPMAMTPKIQKPTAHSSDEKAVPLRQDIRLLGRILGDTVREQEGEEVFELVEQIRQASIRFHRDNEVGARRELEATLDSLNADQTLAIVRAYSYFSHLANIAEDQHHIRRNRAHAIAGSSPRPGSLAYAFNRAHEAGLDAKALRDFFDHALVSPVLTAHPTEVRRKSTLTRELEIAALLDARERQAGDDAEHARIEEQLRCAILLLWRTNMLRQTRLKVIDEVANALTFYDYTFFRELPRIYAAIEDELARWEPKAAHKRIASFLRVGSWIGGDRDGNPVLPPPGL